MGRKKVNGVCHLCGNEGKLSFEHVPPESAFNNRRVYSYTVFGPYGLTKADIQQSGVGAHTLCEPCNNDTGAWYVPALSKFVVQVDNLVKSAQPASVLSATFKIQPLSVIKQIVCMQFSRTTEPLREMYPELKAFVLGKETHVLDRRFGVYICIPSDRKVNSLGLVREANVLTGKTCTFCQFQFPPLGYILTLGCASPNPHLLDITFFADSQYGETREMALDLPVI